ncbi:hypothetical protein ED855_19700 [Acinetobacter baumannii]|nr:hypothetical protein ED855_19700 [Acinetobacter baumannii]
MCGQGHFVAHLQKFAQVIPDALFIEQAPMAEAIPLQQLALELDFSADNSDFYAPVAHLADVAILLRLSAVTP